MFDFYDIILTDKLLNKIFFICVTYFVFFRNLRQRYHLGINLSSSSFPVFLNLNLYNTNREIFLLLDTHYKCCLTYTVLCLVSGFQWPDTFTGCPLTVDRFVFFRGPVSSNELCMQTLYKHTFAYQVFIFFVDKLTRWFWRLIFCFYFYTLFLC